MITHAQRQLVLVGLLAGCGLLSQAHPAYADTCCEAALEECENGCGGSGVLNCDMTESASGPLWDITCHCGDLTPLQFLYIC
jgi:hypothetical protein